MHVLWNRYGACLGNSGRSDEAVAAYKTALAIQPRYVRAVQNLATLHVNLGNSREGARWCWEVLRAWERGGKEVGSEDGDGVMRIVRVGTSHGRLEDIGASEREEMWGMLRGCCGRVGRSDVLELVGKDMDLKHFGDEMGFQPWWDMPFEV